jgi:cholesterol oxidase
MWLPLFRFFGFFRLTYYRHIGILSGVGVGGGSLVYANTLPIPKLSFYTSKSWTHLANWEEELKEFYPIKLKMLGADRNPRMELGDIALQELAKDLNKEDEFKAINVSIFFGKPGETVPESVF